MKTSVVIPTLNRPELVRRLLDCLSEQSLLPDEIVIVEQGGQDIWGFQPQFFYSFPVYLIYEDIRSLARSREIGVRQSDGDYIFFFDDDVLVPKDYIKIALNFLKENSDAMGVGGIYIDSHYCGPSWMSNVASRLMGIRGGCQRNMILPSGWGDSVQGKYRNYLTKSDWLFGCNFTLKRSVFDNVHFEADMQSWSFLEDLFLGANITEQYGPCLYLHPGLKVMHDSPGSSGHLTPKIIRMQIIHRYIFWRDHAKPYFDGRFYCFVLGLFMTFLLTLRGVRFRVGLTENIRSWVYIFNNRNMGWDDANSFIFAAN